MHATARELFEMDSRSMQKYSFLLKIKKLLVFNNSFINNTINVKEKLKECEIAIWTKQVALH